MDGPNLERGGQLYRALGEAFLEAVGDENDLFLYVEAGDGWLDISPFKVRQEFVEWIADLDVSDMIWNAREAESPENRWTAMEYEVADGKFSVRFKYADELIPDAWSDTRREAILRRRFHNKSIRYPEVP